MEIVPLRDQVILEIRTDEVTEGGIILPDKSKKDKKMFVVSYGSGCGIVKKDDWVIGDATEMKRLPDLDGRELVIIKEKDILAIIKGD